MANKQTMANKQAIGKKGQNFKHTFCSKGQYLIIFRTKPKLNFALPFPQLASVMFFLSNNKNYREEGTNYRQE